MDPQGVWQGWSREVRRIVPGIGVWQQRALALFSLGVASAKHCGAARVAAVVPGAATVPSTTRRFERLLANERLDVRAARAAVGTAPPASAARRVRAATGGRRGTPKSASRRRR